MTEVIGAPKATCMAPAYEGGRGGWAAILGWKDELPYWGGRAATLGWEGELPYWGGRAATLGWEGELPY
eukprot:3498409-Prymnesium_polylepis.1